MRKLSQTFSLELVLSIIVSSMALWFSIDENHAYELYDSAKQMLNYENLFTLSVAWIVLVLILKIWITIIFNFFKTKE